MPATLSGGPLSSKCIIEIYRDSCPLHIATAQRCSCVSSPTGCFIGISWRIPSRNQPGQIAAGWSLIGLRVLPSQHAAANLQTRMKNRFYIQRNMRVSICSKIWFGSISSIFLSQISSCAAKNRHVPHIFAGSNFIVPTSLLVKSQFCWVKSAKFPVSQDWLATSTFFGWWTSNWAVFRTGYSEYSLFLDYSAPQYIKGSMIPYNHQLLDGWEL